MSNRLRIALAISLADALHVNSVELAMAMAVVAFDSIVGTLAEKEVELEERCWEEASIWHHLDLVIPLGALTLAACSH